MEKTQARLFTRRQVAALTKREKAKSSRAIVETIAALPELAAAGTLMAFASLPDEADLSPLWKELLACGKTLLFPILAGERGRMDAHIVTNPKKDLTPGRFGLAEPHDGLPVDPGSIDFIFVPALAYDHSGHRLGRGGGYYDRFLSGRAPRAFRCGVAFECQVLESVPIKEHDCLVHALVTEKCLRRFDVPLNCSSPPA